MKRRRGRDIEPKRGAGELYICGATADQHTTGKRQADATDDIDSKKARPPIERTEEKCLCITKVGWHAGQYVKEKR